MIYQLVLNTNSDYTRAMKENYQISHLSKLPKWRRPEALLILMAIAMPLARPYLAHDIIHHLAVCKMNHALHRQR